MPRRHPQPKRVPLAIRWRPDLLATLDQIAAGERITLTEAIHRAVEAGLAAPALRAEVGELRAEVTAARERARAVAGLLEQIEADCLEGHAENARLRAQLERARERAVMP